MSERTPPEPLPEHLAGPFPERSALGGKTGETIVRCKICLASAPVDDWRTVSHEPGCRHPVESYVTADEELVVQAAGSSEEWASTSTPIEAPDAPDQQPESSVDWTLTADSLGEEGDR